MGLDPSWHDKIRYLFNKPGWFPQELGGYRPAPSVDKTRYQKYDTPSPMALSYYVLFQYVICLVGTAMFLFNQTKFSMQQKALVAVLISLTVMNCGVLFERKSWVFFSEWSRIILYPVTLIAAAAVLGWPAFYMGAAAGYLLVSVTWFYFITRSKPDVHKV